MIVQKIKNFIFEKTLNRLLDTLETLDYQEVKHTVLQFKWAALKNNDDYTYGEAEAYYNCLDILEKFYCKQGGK